MHAQSAVVAAEVRASRWIQEELHARMPPPGYSKVQQLESVGKEYVLRVFAVFAREACELGKHGGWSARQIGIAVMDFLKSLAFDLRADYSHLGMPSMLGTFNEIRPEVLYELKASREWSIYQDELMKVADFQDMFPHRSTESTKLSASGDVRELDGTPASKAKTISEKLDDIVMHDEISHEELASKMKLGRTTYFQVKAGRGGRKSKKKVEIFINQWYQRHTN